MQELGPLYRKSQERLPGGFKLLLEGEGAFQVGGGHGSENMGCQTDRKTDIDTLSFHTKKPDYISNFPHYL